MTSLKRLFVYCLAFLLLAGCAERPGVAQLRKGARALARGKYAESVALLQLSLKRLESNNERAAAYNCIGIACSKLGREKDAIEAFESAAAANPASFEPYYNLGIANLRENNDDKAVACFEKASLLNQEDARPLEFLSIVYCRRQQWDDARRTLSEAEKSSTQPSRILTSLALVELKANNTNQALEYLQKALEQDQHYAPAIYNLAVINQLVLHKNDQALPLFVEYARLAPASPRRDQAKALIKEIESATIAEAATNAPPPQKPAAPPPEQKAELASAENRAPVQTTNAVQQPAASLPSFEELMETAKKLEQQGRREAAFNNYLRIARAAEQADRTAVKNQAIRHATSLADGNAKAAYDLGNYFMEKNREEDAVAFYKAAAGQDGDAYFSSMALAKLAFKKGDYDAAIVSLKKADQLRPEDPEALWLLGDLYGKRLGMTNAAEQAYARFVGRFPNDSRAAEAKTRLNAMNPELKPRDAASDKPKQRSFFERMFK